MRRQMNHVPVWIGTFVVFVYGIIYWVRLRQYRNVILKIRDTYIENFWELKVLQEPRFVQYVVAGMIFFVICGFVIYSTLRSKSCSPLQKAVCCAIDIMIFSFVLAVFFDSVIIVVIGACVSGGAAKYIMAA